MIISLSGRKQQGKDTVALIIQKLVPHYNFQNKKFAEKLKQIVALLIGCKREDLEDEVFKNTVLGKEWWKWELPNGKYVDYYQKKIPILQNEDKLIKMTPRKMLQILGTDCCRDLIHPEIWVNSLMAEYNKDYILVPKKGFVNYGGGYATEEEWKSDKKPPLTFIKPTEENSDREYANWIVTDCRFPNEAEAIKDKKGILIRVERPWFYRFFKDDEGGKHVFSDKEDETGNVYRMSGDRYSKEEALVVAMNDFNSKQPESETALDDYQNWDYLIFNDGTLIDLEEKVKEILIKEGLLTLN